MSGTVEWRDAGRADERRTWLWVAVGCGGLALAFLCILPPVVWLLVAESSEGVAPVVTDPAVDDPDPAVPAPPPPSSGFPEPPPSSPAGTSPRRVTAVVEEVTGAIAARVGTACAFDVTRHDRADGTFWCNAQVSCAGQLLYGGQGAGYFDCTLYERPQRHVVGEDPSTTQADGDAAMRLDTLGGLLTVRDDPTGRLGAFALRARVSDVR